MWNDLLLFVLGTSFLLYLHGKLTCCYKSSACVSSVSSACLFTCACMSASILILLVLICWGVFFQVTQLCMMLNALLVKEIGEPDELEAFFLQALYWSIGGALLEDGRAKFDTYTKYLASANLLQDETAMAGPGMAWLAQFSLLHMLNSLLCFQQHNNVTMTTLLCDQDQTLSMLTPDKYFVYANTWQMTTFLLWPVGSTVPCEHWGWDFVELTSPSIRL